MVLLATYTTVCPTLIAASSFACSTAISTSQYFSSREVTPASAAGAPLRIIRGGYRRRHFSSEGDSVASALSSRSLSARQPPPQLQPAVPRRAHEVPRRPVRPTRPQRSMGRCRGEAVRPRAAASAREWDSEAGQRP